MHFQPNLEIPRWVACIDLLGTRKLVAAGNAVSVFVVLTHALEKCKEYGNWTPGFEYVWFSDTFLVIAPDDTEESFHRMDYVARYFSNDLLIASIPFRGSISCDRCYADFGERVFFGSAIVESYEYAEAQNWIGLLLCPSASKRIGALGVTVDTRHYALCEVPWKRSPNGAPNELLALVIGNDRHVNYCNPRIESLEGMLEGILQMRRRIQPRAR